MQRESSLAQCQRGSRLTHWHVSGEDARIKHVEIMIMISTPLKLSNHVWDHMQLVTVGWEDYAMPCPMQPVIQ